MSMSGGVGQLGVQSVQPKSPVVIRLTEIFIDIRTPAMVNCINTEMRPAFALPIETFSHVKIACCCVLLCEFL